MADQGDRVTKADDRRFGRSVRWRPRLLTADQAAALEADTPPSRLIPHTRREKGLGPAHLSTDRVRTTPVPMPPDS